MSRSFAPARLAGLVLAFTLGGAAPALAAWSNNSAVNNVVCSSPGNQDSVQTVSDGAHGIILVWQDSRTGGSDIYAQRFTNTGVRAVGWAVNGTAICTSADQQLAPVICTDDSSGAIIAWQDRRGGTSYDIYAQRVRSNGTVAWAANGIVVCNAANDQTLPDIVRDGAGGAIITWEDRRAGAGNSDIRAARINASGVLVGGWTVNGTVIASLAGDQLKPRLCTDMLNGALIAWQDHRGADYDIYATRVLSTGAIAAGFPANGVAVCASNGDQTLPRADSDSTNGAIVAWQDLRGADSDIYGQHVDGGGVVTWGVNGTGVCIQPNHQTGPIVISDGVGGGIFGWTDARNLGATGTDIYSQLMTPGGVNAWPLNGVVICGATGDQTLFSMDRECQIPWGAFFAWEDNRNPTTDTYVGRILATGVVPPKWTNGIAVGTAAFGQTRPDVIFDYNGGAIAGFTDRRAGNDDIYAQRVTCSGILGTANPAIAAVDDVPNDQGAHVRVRWAASPLDANLLTMTGDLYHLWRQAPGPAAVSTIPQGASFLGFDDPPPLGAAPGTLRRVLDPESQAINYWELVASVPARGFSGYSLVTATTGDSIGGSNPRTMFMVEFEDSDGNLYDSDPALGYSVDNLSPAGVQSFGGYYAGGMVRLSWQPNTEVDLGGYRLYRGTIPGFVPGPANLISAQADTGFTDASPGAYFYKLAAVDVHGNRGPLSVLAPGQVVSAPDAPGFAAAWLGPATPNPFASRTSIRLGLSRAGHVAITLFDVGGRRVRRILDDSLPAGEQSFEWDGRSDLGDLVPGGLYFYRVNIDGNVLVGRVIRMR